MTPLLPEVHRQLTAAVQRSRRPWRRSRLALVAGLACAGAVAAILLVVTPADRLDPVAQARAALAPAGEIVYMKITTRAGSRGGGRASASSTTEQWSAVDPPRWRLVQVVPPPSAHRGTAFDEHGPIVGRQELAYAHGEQRSYVAQRDTLDIQRGVEHDGPATRPPSALAFEDSAADPAVELRAMLERGKVSDAGDHRIDGRTVRRLTGTQRDDNTITRLIYDVDPETFAPVQAVRSIHVTHVPRLPAGFPVPRLPVLTLRIHVDAYRRIALNQSTARLLTINTTPHTKVTVHTATEHQAMLRRLLRRCHRGKPGASRTCVVLPSKP